MASPGTEEVTLRWEVPENMLRKIKIVDERISRNRIRLNKGSYTFSMRDGQTRYFTVEVK
jgi:hypothetical protein